jgi:hypothetical protein
MMADADEATGQDVEQKPAEEGGGLERGESRGVPVGAILPPEGDVVVLQRDETIVGEGDPIGIAAEVREDRLGAGQGRLAVHDPPLPRGLLERPTGVVGRSSFPSTPFLRRQDNLLPQRP